jgi:hypothetical protein
MADIDPEVNIEALHTAIRDQLAAAFPDFQTVQFYRDDEDTLFPLPAILLAMTEVEPQPDSDAGTNQLPALLRFEAHVVMGHRSPATHMAVRKAATALAAWLFKHRFSPCDETQVIACEPDEFAPKADKFMIWRVEFVMLAFLGETAWTNDGTVPTDALYSWSPDIGIGNADKYENAVQPLP